ncbi:hypothetical protein B9T31_04195 [Acinetobacter sp. ANC 4558]|uniref:phage baseplate assembly protein n=1 Tax=Acinetobacter sp. ANC 4558 TaxID=1977876 RepID=UPI000A34E48A|nr:hypothetical protein [Acinetobacter sp. ANC 4558]OTG87705.1 hypothetical protein B9T31_04195 [Acinetobacter sp. ANC 4558]
MQDEEKVIRLVIGGVEIRSWDSASIDSSIDTPADSWSFSLFSEQDLSLPDSVRAGAKVQAYYGDELILTSVADAVNESCDRSGYGLKISGRDLAGQLIDCSVPIFNGRQVNLDVLLNQYVLGGELKSLFPKMQIQNNAWLKNKVSVEPGESLWDAITKAAMVTGQHVWLDPDGTIRVGDPFASPILVKTALKLHRDGLENNVLDASYDEDISNVFSDIRLLSQDSKAQNILSSTKAETQFNFNRLKLITLPDAETKSEADAALEKIKKDNNLQAYALMINTSGWDIDNRIWATGMYLNFETDRLNRATAKWAVYGRKFTFSRMAGKRTTLKLHRQGDWAQPLKHKEKTKPIAKKSKSKTSTSKVNTNE